MRRGLVLTLATVRRACRAVREALPRGLRLSEESWRARHLGVLILLAGLVAGVPVTAMERRGSLGHGLLDAAPAAAMAVAALLGRSNRRTWKSGCATLGLLFATAAYVHLSDGLIEMHFLFFVCLGMITLYQDWAPFLLAVAFTALHHAVAGLLDPESVFNHAAAVNAPLKWAFIHAGFVIAACFTNLVAWKANEQNSVRDPLTRLANRVLLTERVGAALSQRRATAVLFIDLCGFKRVNDVLGHDAGDVILRDVARRLRQSVRAQDTVARFGGDEFVIVLVDADEMMAQKVAARIRTELDAPIRVHGMDLRVGASVGIAVAGVDGDTTEGLLRSADMAMYAAKREGGGTGAHQVVTPAMEETARTRLAMETDLRYALERKELSLVYQPVLNMRTGRLRGFEALLRWHSPVYGSVSPATFIPLAEETGLIMPIGEWVLREATAQVARWKAAGWHDGLALSVNVSTCQLRASNFPAQVRGALRSSGIRPASLVLELTESALAGDEATGALIALKGLGVNLALDDFGTGYSSLSYLGRLPIDVIKIDKCFTDHVPGGANEPLTAAVFALADRLGVRTVVEGVELDSQVGPLLAMGAQYGQGYLWDRPLVPEAAAALIANALTPAV
jgi:diguanylate cyclase